MAGGTITTGSHPKLLWPGIHAIWGQIYNEHAKEYLDLFDQLTSDKAYEEEYQVTGFELATIKAQGDSISYDSEIGGATSRYQHIPYAKGFIVTKEENEDNLYEIVAARRAKALAFSMNQTIDTVAAFLYNNAFVSTYFTTGDGAALLSSSHVNVTGGNYSNILSPGADLSESSLEDLTIQMMGAQTDRGLLINIMPQSLHVSPTEWYNANRILESVLQSNSASNNINVLKATNAFPKGIKMNHFFTAANAWFVRTNCPSGMQMFWRNKPEFNMDNDFDTSNIKHSCYMRFSVGATDPRGLYGSAGA